MEPVNVLFVCLGNICRSPMAEGLFAHLVTEAGLTGRLKIDSAGTSGFHAGELADARMRQTAKGYGVELVSRSRAVEKADFKNFQYILAMDRRNHGDLLALAQKYGFPSDHVLLMRSFEGDPASLDVPDPYYGGQEGFDEVYHILHRATSGFLAHLRTRHAW